MSATNAMQLAEWANVPRGLAKLTVAGAERHGMDLRQVRSNSRRMNLVRARWWIVAKAREQGFSFPQIGRALNRDHSTIMHGAKRVAG